jgi:hypothetical protein
MARARTAKHPEFEPEAVGDPSPDVSKADMVRAALAEGMESPTDGLGFIKSKFGVDFPRPMWSSYKAQIRAQEQQKALKRGRPGRKPKAAVEGDFAPPKPATSGGQSELLAALEAIKPLVESMGKEQVHRIVDLLG